MALKHAQSGTFANDIRKRHHQKMQEAALDQWLISFFRGRPVLSENKFAYEERRDFYKVALQNKKNKGKLLLMLSVLNMYLTREAVFSSPICTPGSFQCQVLLSDLFDRAIRLSHYIHSLSTEMFEDIDQQYAEGRQLIIKAMNICHTSTLSTPEDKDQTLQMQNEDLLSLINKLLRSWSQPLHYLSAEAPNNIMQKVKEAEEHARILQGGIDRISGRMLTDLEDFYPQWFGPVDVTAAKGDPYLFPVYHLLHCFRRDSHKIDSYLKILRCRMINPNC